MDMDDRPHLHAECARLEGEILVVERALDGLKSDADETQRMQLATRLRQHLAELGQVNARLSELRGLAEGCAGAGMM
jgi:hypothetical protein